MLTLSSFELHFYSSFALQSVSLICNLYRFSAQQQQEENSQKKKMSYQKKSHKNWHGDWGANMLLETILGF